MKYVNDKENIYVNNYGVAIATVKPLNEEQQKAFDKSVSFFEPLQKYNGDDSNIVDKEKTKTINSTAYFPKPKSISDFGFENRVHVKDDTPWYLLASMNPVDLHFEEMNAIKEYVMENYKIPKGYSLYCDTLDYFNKDIPDRFKAFRTELYVEFDPLKLSLDKDTRKLTVEDYHVRLRGECYHLINAIRLVVPVLMQPDSWHYNLDLLQEKDRILQNLYFHQKGVFIHELKHGLNHYNLANVMKDKKISIKDLFKLQKIEELSAETEDAFFMLEQKVRYGKSDIFRGPYKHIEEYAEKNPNYFEKLDEFAPMIFEALEKTFVPLYDEGYNIRMLNPFKTFFENVTEDETDEGVYEYLRREKLSFGVYNSKTGKSEIVDLSRYLKDTTIEPKELEEVKKFYKKLDETRTALKKKNLVSNEVRRAIDKARE